MPATPYQLALIAHAPDGLHDVARTNPIHDDRIAAFMAKVEVAADEGLAGYYPARWPARVEVETDAGRRMELVLDAPGDPGSRFDFDQARAKFGIYASSGDAPGDWIDLCGRAIADDDALENLVGMIDQHFTASSSD